MTAADPAAGDGIGADGEVEAEVDQDGQLLRGVDPVDVEGGVGLGEPVRLRVGEDLRERLPLARHAA